MPAVASKGVISVIYSASNLQRNFTQFCNRKARLDHMFPVAYARVSSKTTKAADSDTGDTDAKKVLQKNYFCKLGSDTDGACS